MTSRVLQGFEYLEPGSVGDAVSMLSEHSGDVKVLAGGTDLLIYMKLRVLKPGFLVDIKKIPSLGGVQLDSDGLHIGAATTIRTLERSGVVGEKCPLLMDTIASFGSVQVRNMATLGGNICNASPGADFATPLLALGTQLKIVGSGGERTVGLDGFFTGPDQSVLKGDELLTEFIIPPSKLGAGSAYMKLGRVSMDLSKVNVAAVVKVEGGVCVDVGIALGAVAPTPIRAKAAEAALKGKGPTAEVIGEAGAAASAESSPRTSLRSTAEYKREVVGVLVKRCLGLALKRGSG